MEKKEEKTDRMNKSRNASGVREDVMTQMSFNPETTLALCAACACVCACICVRGDSWQAAHRSTADEI